MPDATQDTTPALRYAWPVILTAALMLPSVAWISADRSVWPWDQASYGYSTLRLYFAPWSKTSVWRKAMETSMTDRAAGVCWVGQFFVPVGRGLGSVDRGLLLSIVATQLATLLCIWGLGRRLAPEAGWRVPLAGCILAAGAPLFIGMTHQFFPEPLQALAVAWIFYLAVASRSLSRLQAFSQLLAAASLGMTAKISTPLYCLLPGLLALWNVFPRREASPRPLWKTALDLGCLTAAVGLALLTYRWYYVNWDMTIEHLRQASSGEASLFYGRRDSFTNKMIFWIGQVKINLCTPKVLWLLAATATVAALWRVVRFVRRTPEDGGISRGDLATLAGAAHLLGVIASFALSVNEEPRYLLPLLPAAALLLMWSLAQVPASVRWPGWAVVVLLLLQWAMVHAVALDAIERPVAMSHWIIAVERDRTKTRELELLFERLSADERTAQRYSVVGVDCRWLNASSLMYLEAKRELRHNRAVVVISLPWCCKNEAQGMKHVDDCNALYIVSLTKEALGTPDFLNQAAGPIRERLSVDQRFVRESFASRAGLVLFRRR